MERLVLTEKMETDLWRKDEINRLTHLNLLGPGTFKEPSFLGYQVFLTFSGVGVCFTCCLLISWIYETSNRVILLSVWHRLGRVWHPKSPNHQGFFGVTQIPKKLEITATAIHFDVQLRFKGYKQLPPLRWKSLQISKHHWRPPTIRAVSASSSVLGGPGSFHHAVQWWIFLQAIWINKITHKNGEHLTFLFGLEGDVDMPCLNQTTKQSDRVSVSARSSTGFTYSSLLELLENWMIS